MSKLDGMTMEKFKKLPFVIEGESKEIRYAGDGEVIIYLKPTIYSFTHNRCNVVEGSNILRVTASMIFANLLKNAGIKHAYKEGKGEFILADLLIENVKNQGNFKFIPDDIDYTSLKRTTPIEVIIKRMHTGTSKHKYYKMNEWAVRQSHPLVSGFELGNNQPYPETLVRFDWRNPFENSEGVRLDDQVLDPSVADWFINTKEARKTALGVYNVLSEFLNSKDIVCYDLCLFISEDGKTVYGEISQDCGRYRHFDLGSLDKDVWRAGGSFKEVLEKWELLNEMILSKGI